ncbi:hypothetical protein Ahy_B08g090952 isoform F [Arachis hypogaea]|uniref:Uncharacterized protein n=1 Tax=Arachis hypogaea TaxID=3818 RepID=A0A444Y104_ARAHY|nr:hypothetical protein Ahy_B08g090952 isoform F [Arachis hypogaea]
MLEAELSDIQERYFHMSLKYAEVEAEREELVMKLKEVGLMEETKRLLSEKEILSLKVENLLGKINLLESDLSFFVENEIEDGLKGLKMKMFDGSKNEHSPESCEERWDDEEEVVAAERASEVNFADEISGINTGPPSPTSSNESSVTS